MAARKNKIHPDPGTIERIRQSIQASKLVKCLEDHAIEAQEMVPSRVTAALGLLKKVIPDMGTLTHTGGDGGPISITVTHRVIDKP